MFSKISNFIFLIFLFTCGSSIKYQNGFYSIYFNQQWIIQEGRHHDSVAWVHYLDLIEGNGWIKFSAESNPFYEDDVQSYGVGYLEGCLTSDRIYQAFMNYVLINKFSNMSLPINSGKFVSQQMAWLRNQVAQNTDPTNELYHYWQHIGSTLSQLDGLVDGYNNCTSNQTLRFDQVYMLTNMGDLEDILPAFGESSTSLKYMKEWRMECSGLIKLHPELKDLYAGHTTFNGYSYMLRVFKFYNLPLHNRHTSSRITSFSSRPGDLESKDDYFLLESGLVVIETSLAVFNKTLYQNLNPHSVPTWLRLNVVNRMANSADEWSKLFSLFNSGTHNNQWEILDYKKFTPSILPPSNTIWLLEQMPGVIESADITDIFNKLYYFPSFNIPYFPNIFNISGYRAAGYSYENDPRYKMFKAYSPQIDSFDKMKYLMNSNDYKNDPFSNGDACNAISARCDLRSSGAYAFGGVDSKNTNYQRSQSLISEVICGPTHQTAPAFSWDQWKDVPHLGMPQVFDFDWVVMAP